MLPYIPHIYLRPVQINQYVIQQFFTMDAT